MFQSACSAVFRVHSRKRTNDYRRLLGFAICAVVLTAISAPSAFCQAKKPKPKLPSQQFKGYGLPPSAVQPPTVDIKVSAVDSASRSSVQSAADRIDELVEANYVKHALQPNKPASDQVFLRRVYLDLAGRIPALEEVQGFLTSKKETRRQDLIDTLLGSPNYISHNYNYWASLLRIVDRPHPNILGYPFREWVKDQLAKNRPYDEFVYEMLAAEGRIYENPAVGYTLRDIGMPLVHVDNTIRVFLGTQIGCAQCHNHPFDKWTQKEFYQLAAFLHGIETRDGNGTPAFKNGNPVNRIREELKKIEGEEHNPGRYNNILNANLFNVRYVSNRKLQLPHDYSYEDAKPKQVIQPSVLWGEIPAEAKGKSNREQFAAWVTSADNPRFAKTMANRIWKRMFGYGLIEPVDDMRDDSKCENPELLEFLTNEFVRLDFDMKELIRTIAYTKTYQRESSLYDVSQGEHYHFPGPIMRRLTAEQVWDSIMVLAIRNPYGYRWPTTNDVASVTKLDLATASGQEVKERLTRYNESVEIGAINKGMREHSYRGQVLVRASELPSPLPADHFIRQFGQCDRETIEGDSLDATVPQILTMFNGPFTHMMLEKGSVIGDHIARSTNSRDAIENIFLTILARRPSSTDREIAGQEVSGGDPASGFGNVVWALINTREFLFIQ